MDGGMRRMTARSCLVLVLSAYPAWLGMCAVHELGHVIHAVVGGGREGRVELPLVGFSRTEPAVNPRPLFVAWGGAIWGCLVPLAVCVLARRGWIAVAARAFAGFCLICNGAYVGFGPAMTAGDGFDMMRLGAPAWSLVAFGVVATAGGLLVWHRAGSVFIRGRG
jgi:hypothetical protein